MRFELKHAMRRRGFTHAELAKALGVAHPTISNWIYRKRCPRPEMLDLLCYILRCPISELLIPEMPLAVLKTNAEIKRDNLRKECPWLESV